MSLFEKTCPTETDLERFLEDGGPNKESITTHVRSCVVCQRSLDTIASDPELDIQKNSLRKGFDFGKEAECQQLVYRLVSHESVGNQENETAKYGIEEQIELALPLIPGDLASIDGYRLIREMGRGAMSIVYEGIDTSLNRPVAIKVLRSFTNEVNSAKRFTREAAAIAAISHPNVVSIFHTGRGSSKTPFLVMELVRGPTLQEFIKKHGRLNPRTAARWIAEVADGLAAAHALNIVHRDIKPGNILLAPIDSKGEESSSFVARLADFGLAKTQHMDPQLTQSGYITGTPAYLSPEQVLSLTASTASDIYSLGISLYEAITGELPFRGATHAVLQQIVAGDLPRPRKWDPSIPMDIETICLKATHYKSSQRYSTAKAFADDLRRWLANEPIRARPASKFERTKRWCERNRRIASLLTIIIALLSFLAIGGIWSAISIAGARDALALQVIAARNANEAAVASKAQALEQRQLALDSLNTLIIRVQSQLTNRPGTLKLRESLLRTALEGLNRVTKNESDQQLDHSTIEARMRMSMIHTVLGDSKAANEATSAALAMAERALDANPKSMELQIDLARSLALQARQRLSAGNETEARNLYLRALGLLDPIRMELSDDASVQITWIDCIQFLAMTDTPEQKVSRLETLLAEIESLLMRFSDNTTIQRAKVITSISLADSLNNVGREGVKERLQAVIPAATELKKSDPENITGISDLAALHSKLSRISCPESTLDDELEHAKIAIELFQEVASLDAGNRRWEMVVGTSWSQLGQVLANRGEFIKANDAYQKAYAIFVRLSTIDKSAPNYKLLTLDAASRLGNLHFQSGDYEQSLMWCEKALQPLENGEAMPDQSTLLFANYRYFFQAVRDELRSAIDAVPVADNTAESPTIYSVLFRKSLRLSIDARQNKVPDLLTSVAAICNAMPTANTSDDKELALLFRGGLQQSLAATLIAFHRKYVHENDEPSEEAIRCLQLAIRLMGDYIREQPGSTTDVLSSFDFREHRSQILQSRDRKAIDK